MSDVRPRRNRWRIAVALSAGALTTALLPGAVEAHTPPGGEVSNAAITSRQLLTGAVADGLTRNHRFAPGADARRARQGLTGTLRLRGSTMQVLSDAAGGGISTPVMGKDTTFFPDVSLSFFTTRGQLVPTTQDVIRNGVLPKTRSFWDVIVQPGRVWSEPGDRGWNRASFPFALVNSIEGETHTGIAMFMYKGKRVSPVRYQVVQMTSPYYVPEYFTAWGTTRAAFRPGGIDRLRRRVADHRAEMRARLPQRPWSDLERVVDRGTLDDFVTYPDFVRAGVVRNGTLYGTECPTAAGAFPYCEQVRYGVWSVTKSAMLNAAMLRLAQKYGPRFVDRPIARYVPRADVPGWDDVTFRDLAMMASGHGPEGDPTCYLCDYDRWYIAPSEAEKTREALDYPAAFEPGTVLNYRDQDTYLLGVALDALVKRMDGPRASVWEVLRREVYRPLGIHHAPTNATVERGRSPGQPLMSYGYYPTFDDLAKIALLYQNGGSWKGRQILAPALTRQIAPSPRPTPPTGALRSADDGSEYYFLNWWFYRLESTEGCSTYLPEMSGYGGNTVTLAPDRTVVLRMRNDWNGAPNPQASINALADALTRNCS